MSKQSMGGCKKRPRRPRAAHKILAQETRKEKWLAKLKNNPKAQKPKKRGLVLDLSHEHVVPKDIRPTTIEDMYKTYRVTKGRQGLNPNPDKRQPENPWVTQTRQVKPGIFVANPMTGRFPITELMSKPIQYSTPS